MEKWKECTISDIGTVVGGATPSTKVPENYIEGRIAWITPKDLSTFHSRYIEHGERNITERGLHTCSTTLLPPNTILFSSRAPIGYIAIAKNALCTNQGFKNIIPNTNIHPLFLYYLLKNNKDRIENMGSGTTFKEVSAAVMNSISIRIPEKIQIQQKITKLLGSLDDEIELNRQINTNLEQQVLAYYNYLFIDNYNVNRRKCRMNEYFDISIGKTPPRQETQWFKTQSNDVVWVSISDMAKCGLYINKSSEQLTKEAIKKFNIPVVPDNTLLLSFKLTIGRIAITNGELATNEAIAHFKTDQKIINEYLYCYLKRFDYDKMGNTSSIAVALNSRLIKEMPFIIPESHELQTFYDYAHCRFQYIKANLSEISTLSTLRDTILPKLMSGEIDVSKIELE